MVEIRFKKLISLISSGRDFSGHSSHTDLGISEDEEILGIDLRDLLDMERLEGGMDVLLNGFQNQWSLI